MEKSVKKELFRVFNIGAFLFITIFFLLPYLVQINIYFHEKSHQKILDKYNVENNYNFNLLEVIPNFFNFRKSQLGLTSFDLKAYKKLNYNQRLEIHTAGIISDLKILFLIGFLLSLINVYVYYKFMFKRYSDLTLILAINWILFIWLLALIQITIANISYSNGDIARLLFYLK